MCESRLAGDPPLRAPVSVAPETGGCGRTSARVRWGQPWRHQVLPFPGTDVAMTYVRRPRRDQALRPEGPPGLGASPAPRPRARRDQADPRLGAGRLREDDVADHVAGRAVRRGRT